MAHNKQRGVALITALLITTIAAAIATLMFVQQRANIDETGMMANSDRAPFYLAGTLGWADAVLTNGAKRIIAQKLPEPLKPMPKATFQTHPLTATITDQQGLFNINSVTNLQQQAAFGRLLHTVNPNLTNAQIIQLTQNLQDWLIPSNDDPTYARKVPPYADPHQPMASISELRLVDGFTAQLYQELKPYITALPSTVTKININTAPAPVLTTLSDDFSFIKARTLVDLRTGEEGFATLDEVTNALRQIGVNAAVIQPKIIISGSNYFLLTASIELDQISYTLYTLLNRTIGDQTHPATITVIQQTRTL